MGGGRGEAASMAFGLIRKILPSTVVDALAMSATTVALPLGYLHAVLYVTPSLYSVWEYMYWVHICCMTYLLACILIDLALAITTDTSCQGVSLPVVVQPGWAHCHYCQQHAPPRSHHCLTCRRCILRRDHHCLFIGKCVGYFNHRYFILLLLHAAMVGVYGIILSLRLMSQMEGEFSLLHLVAVVFPMVIWVVGLAPSGIYVILLSSLAFMLALVTGGMLILQLFFLYRDQTWWEAQTGVRRPVGWLRNVNDLFGPRWWLMWICPLVPSPLPNDGTHYGSDAASSSSQANTAQPVRKQRRKLA